MVFAAQDALLQALARGQQPDTLADAGATAVSAGRVPADLADLTELLGQDPSLTPEQLQHLSSLLRQQEQQEEQRVAADEEAAEFGGAASEGVECSLQDDGVAFEWDAEEGGGSSSSSNSKQHFQCLMNSPLWQCQEETAQVQLCQAMFLLMAWKMDFVVRDAAFIALLGILGKLLLPKVRCLACEVQLRCACCDLIREAPGHGSTQTSANNL